MKKACVFKTVKFANLLGKLLIKKKNPFLAQVND